MFVKAIVTLPAFALSVLVLYSSWPLGFADRLSLLPAPLAAGVVLGAAGVVAGVAGVVSLFVVEDELLLLPQPASATRAISVGSASRHLRPERRPASAAAWFLTCVLQSRGCRCARHRRTAILPAPVGAASRILRPRRTPP